MSALRLYFISLSKKIKNTISPPHHKATPQWLLQSKQQGRVLLQYWVFFPIQINIITRFRNSKPTINVLIQVKYPVKTHKTHYATAESECRLWWERFCQTAETDAVAGVGFILNTESQIQNIIHKHGKSQVQGQAISKRT